MKQLDRLWTELQPLLAHLSPEEKENLSATIDRAQKGTSHLELKYHRAIRERAAGHSLLKKSSEELVQRYQTIFENSGTAMVVIENDGTISLASNLFLNLLGYRREDVENRMNFFAIFDERFRDQEQDFHRRRRADDATVPHRYEAQILTSKGKTLDVIIMVGLFPGTRQSVISLIDITDQKQMQDEIRLFKTTADRAYDEIFWLDFEGRIFYVNDAATQKTGYSREELLAMKVCALVPDLDMDIWQDFIKDVRKNGSMIFETRHRLKNGTIMDIEVATTPVMTETQEFIFAFIRDVTDRKRGERDLLQKNEEVKKAYGQLAAAEQELRQQYDDLATSQKLLQESEIKFHSVFNNVTDAIFIHHTEGGAPGRFIEVNDFMCSALGYTRKELLAMDLMEVLSEAHLKDVADISNEIAEKGYNKFYAEFRRKNGSTVPVEVNSHKYQYSGQDVVLAVARDITEWKHAEAAILQTNKELHAAYGELAAAEQELRSNYVNLSKTEEKLRESEAWIREFTDLLPQSVFEMDLEGRLRFVNRRATEVFGITRELLDKGVNMKDFLIPEDWEQGKRNMAQMIAGKKNTYDVYHGRTKDGSLIPTYVYSVPVYRGGTLTGVRGIIIEMTETIQAQEALQKSETRFRELAELLPQIVFELDENLKFTFFNWNTIEMTGFAYEALSQNKTQIFDMMRESDRQPAGQFFTRILKDRETGHMECVILAQDGKEIPAIISASPIISENRITGIRGVIVDITEQKSLEMALRESELRFRELAELVPQFIFETDRNFRFTYLNLGALTIAGYSNEDIMQGLDVLSLVDIADRPQIRDTFTRILNGEVVSPLQFPLNTKDQEKLPVLMYATPIVRDNNYAGIRGIIVDIADQKRLENALATTNKKLNMMNNLTRHDVLNTITGLIGLVDMLGEMTLDSKTQVLVSEIRNLIVKIKNQIIFTRDYQLVGVKVPQWESINKEVRNAASVIGLNGVRLNLPESDAEIYADPLFGKVFYNLMDNSFRHGGSVRSISIETEVVPDGSLIVRYCDDGIGIPPDEKDLIFEQGYGKNTGFGLFIIREILGITGLTILEKGIFRKGVLFEITVPKETWRPVSGEKSTEHDPKKEI